MENGECGTKLPQEEKFRIYETPARKKFRTQKYPRTKISDQRNTHGKKFCIHRIPTPNLTLRWGGGPTGAELTGEGGEFPDTITIKLVKMCAGIKKIKICEFFFEQTIESPY